MKPKHTSGPNAVSYAGPGKPIHVYNRESGDVLATVTNIHDAHLFAVAPSLLEALDELFQASPHDMSDMLEAFRSRQKHNPAIRANDLTDRFSAALVKAQSAIAKATKQK